MLYGKRLNLAALARRHPLRLVVAILALLAYIYYITISSAWLPNSSHPAAYLESPREPIPHKIWQIFFGYTPLDDLKDLVYQWPTKNQDSSYTLVSNAGGEKIVRNYYSDRPDILEPFLELQVPVLRADFLRYMILESEGGFYSDLDTVPEHPISEWIPQQYQDQVRFIVGIEYDQGEREPYPGMDRPLQFCQWTIASAPGHPIIKRAVVRVAEALKAFASTNQTNIAQLKPEDDDVMKITGPVIWTTVIMDVLAEMTGQTVDHTNFTGITEPKLMADVLVLPIDGFGTGQGHSNASRIDGYTPPNAMVRHLWKGSWKLHWG